jgi:hypothetical protein
MFVLHYFLYGHKHKEAFRWAREQWKETCPDMGPFSFEFFCELFNKKHKTLMKEMDPEEFLEWVKENVEFHVVD